MFAPGSRSFAQFKVYRIAGMTSSLRAQFACDKAVTARFEELDHKDKVRSQSVNDELLSYSNIRSGAMRVHLD